MTMPNVSTDGSSGNCPRLGKAERTDRASRVRNGCVHGDGVPTVALAAGLTPAVGLVEGGSNPESDSASDSGIGTRDSGLALVLGLGLGLRFGLGFETSAVAHMTAVVRPFGLGPLGPVPSRALAEGSGSRAVARPDRRARRAVWPNRSPLASVPATRMSCSKRVATVDIVADCSCKCSTSHQNQNPTRVSGDVGTSHASGGTRTGGRTSCGWLLCLLERACFLRILRETSFARRAVEQVATPRSTCRVDRGAPLFCVRHGDADAMDARPPLPPWPQRGYGAPRR